MVIRFKCTCGAMCSADEGKAGEWVRCEACGADLPVPVPQDVPVAEEVATPAGTVGQGIPVKPFGVEGVPAGWPRTGSAAKRAAASRRAPTGKARAAMHIGFKRMMWIPALAIGLICMVAGAYCFIPKTPAKLPDLGVENPQMVTDGEGHTWAIPQGATPRPHENGSMWYENTEGYEEQAVSADDYVKRQKNAAGRQWGFLGFGIGFFAVAGALMFLSLWMWRDVRMVGSGEGERKQPPE